MRTILTFFFISLQTFYFGQSANKKIIVNENCGSLKGADLALFDQINFTEKEFTSYIKKHVKDDFPKIAIEFEILINKSEKACCRRVIISDSSKINNSQITLLNNIVSDFPFNKKIAFGPSVKLKHLTVILGHDKRGRLTTCILGGHTTGLRE